ncbi:hypothetical protein CBM2626_A40030 [Cupriavidus taiwanensis]|nr:hypothetical protein CBM2626_A40030 [Cupriavidus taiwanensis]
MSRCNKRCPQDCKSYVCRILSVHWTLITIPVETSGNEWKVAKSNERFIAGLSRYDIFTNEATHRQREANYGCQAYCCNKFSPNPLDGRREKNRRARVAEA